MKSHEYADLFPMMGENEISRLSQDIKENGLSDSIITFEGKILDGRNRFKACQMVSIEPVFKEYDGSDPLAFVISHNLHRRHLTESQRAMIASSVATIRHGGERGNQYTGGKSSIDGLAKLTNKDRTQAAKELNVSTASVDRARRIQRDGITELQDMVNSGEVTVYAAQSVSKLPEQEQRKAVSGGVSGVKEAAKKASTKEITQEPIKTESTRLKNWIPDDAERLWLLAKQDLNKILKTDKSRVKILNEIISYAQNRLDKNI